MGWEIIGVIVGFIGLIYAIATYNKTYVKEPREDKKFLVERFEFGRGLTLKLKADLVNFSNSFNCYNQEFMQGINFKKTIEILDEVLQKIFNNENYETLKSSQPSKRRFEDLLQRIEAQIKATNECQTYFNLYFKKN